MIKFLRTGEVARMTGISFARIRWALATGRVRPEVDGARQYIWRPKDVEQLRRVAAETALKPAPGRRVLARVTAGTSPSPRPGRGEGGARRRRPWAL
ncbi:MAG TPA: hypothetical protein VFI25_11070 [Planctomycetota bacterium]|nr:hypothetical protein [Planctomycetota bacterium]